jgi:replicative DNA helicase
MDNNTLTDFAAERAVLASIFQYGETGYTEVSDIASEPAVFYDDVHQILFKCFKYLIEKRELKILDQSSVMSAANELGYSFIFEKPDDLSQIKSVFNTQIKLENARHWAAQIRKLQIARMLRNQLNSAIVDIDKITGNESIDSIVAIAENSVFDFSELLTGNNDSEPTLIGNGVREYFRYKAQNPVDQVGISSGYKYYDEYIGGGFRRKTVSLLGARTGIGKSLISDNIGLHISTTLDIPVLYLDTEMSKEDHWHRLSANISDVKIKTLETGQFAKNQVQLHGIKKAIETLENSKFHYLNISGKAFEETISIMRRWIKQHVGYDENGKVKDCLIIYDYIKMMTSDGITAALQEYQLLGFMMTTLHNFAVKYDVPIFSLVQLNRDGIDKETTDVVSGSDRVTWLATNLAVFKPKSDEEIAADFGEKNGTHKLVVIKSRHGGGTPPGDYLNLIMTGDRARIIEGETHINLKRNNFNNNSSNMGIQQNLEEIPFNDPTS